MKRLENPTRLFRNLTSLSKYKYSAWINQKIFDYVLKDKF